MLIKCLLPEKEGDFSNSLRFNLEILNPLISKTINFLLQKNSKKELSNIVLEVFSEIIYNKTSINLGYTYKRTEKLSDDVIVSSLLMPGNKYSGFDEMVRQLKSYDELCFIFLISSLSEAAKKNGFNLFIDGEQEKVEEFNKFFVNHFKNKQITEKFLLNVSSNNKIEKNKKNNNRF